MKISLITEEKTNQHSKRGLSSFTRTGRGGGDRKWAAEHESCAMCVRAEKIYVKKKLSCSEQENGQACTGEEKKTKEEETELAQAAEKARQRERAGGELAVFGDGGNLILEASHEVEGGRVIGKVVDRYSGTVVDVTTSGENGWGRCYCGRQWWAERGGCLDDGGVRKVTHVGGWTKYIVLKEGVGLEEVRRIVSEITSDVLTVHKLWHSLKYDRGMVMELEGNGDLRMFLKGNDERGYLYVGDNDGSKRRAQKATWSYDHGVVCRRSDRDRDDMVQEGRKGVELSASDREVQPRNLEMVQTSFETMVYTWVCAPTGLSAVTPPPPLFLCMFSSSIFTEQKTNIHHGKPCSATCKPMGNWQIATLVICILLIVGSQVTCHVYRSED
ncbi:hypothetical protein Cgig2_008765 [Carnegiea gigantea]|uniref:Uncharacterized protein n=1 Tax=Carnegiea gigantea TaxID=171969 RepID=A0A9Q1QCT6_9CARY|nr:hypothetical protein Cgig2_008765 [Carnegiea gigantea]